MIDDSVPEVETLAPTTADAGGPSNASRPTIRPQRLRRSAAMRAMVAETRLTPQDLIYPIFIQEGLDGREAIDSMPGVDHLSVVEAVVEARKAEGLGIPAVLLFGVPAAKDPIGTASYSPDGIVQRAVAALKAELHNLLVITDVCLCAYTDHGHCGLPNGAGDQTSRPHSREGRIGNDATLPILAKIAVSHARAGADVVAPSGMMDGMVAAVRSALDAEGFGDVAILSYAVKYASNFYGPFREATDGAPAFGDRKTYQMDPANAREALREADLDVAEGVDALMVKPAMAYLDVIHRVKERHPTLPLAAYNVSGEYAMLKAAAERGWLDERAAVLETLLGIKRAGADMIITYHALDAARWMSEPRHRTTGEGRMEG